MKVITETKTLFVATDGKKFESEYDCNEHEVEIMQEEKEKAVQYMKIEPLVEFPSIGYESDMQKQIWFKIADEKEFNQFCDAYIYWFGKSEIEKLRNKKFNYPEIFLIIDYPKGPGMPELFVLSELKKQYETFMDSIANQ